MDKQWAEIAEGLRYLTRGETMIYTGTVVAVDEDEWTCHVKMANGFEIADAHLKAFKEQPNGAVHIPVIGTDVHLLNIGRPDWLVIAVEEIEKTVLIAKTELNVEAAGAKLLMNKDGIVMNDGSNGAMVKIKELEDNLKSLKDYVEAMHSALPAAFTAVKASTLADGALGAAQYSKDMLGKTITLKPMNNEKVKH